MKVTAAVASIPTRNSIDQMSIRELVEELRRTPNPATGAKAHSLTEIARIAGSSVGWPATVLGRPAKSPGFNERSRSNRFGSPLRRYLRKLTEEQGDALRLLKDPVPGVDVPRRRPKPQPEPAPPKVNPLFEQFMLAYEAQCARLLDDAVALKTLADCAPGCFRPAILTAQETLFGLCVSLSIPTPTTNIPGSNAATS